MDEWKKITPPADAEDILTIGAIDNMGVNAAFSSIGNTADGRIKPDVMAMGVHSAVVGGRRRYRFCQWYFFCVAYFLRTGGWYFTRSMNWIENIFRRYSNPYVKFLTWRSHAEYIDFPVPAVIW